LKNRHYQKPLEKIAVCIENKNYFTVDKYVDFENSKLTIQKLPGKKRATGHNKNTLRPVSSALSFYD